MQQMLALLLFLLLGCNSESIAQTSPLDDFKGNWTIMETINSGPYQGTCFTGYFGLIDEKKGQLTLEVSFNPNEKEAFDTYYGTVLFDYTLVKLDTTFHQTIVLDAVYGDLSFKHQIRQPAEVGELPYEQTVFLTELEEQLSKREERLIITRAGARSLTVEGLSLIKSSKYANFQQGNAYLRCY